MKLRLGYFHCTIHYCSINFMHSKRKNIGYENNLSASSVTGGVIWKGKTTSITTKVTGRISTRLANIIGTKAQLPLLFEKYNEGQNKNYLIKEMIFPKAAPYGWNNYPYELLQYLG